MNFIKKNSKGLSCAIASFIILTFIMTLLNYTGLIKYNTVNIIELLIIFISIFIGSFVVGRNSTKKGWLEGLKFSFVFLIILIVFNYLGFNVKFQIKNLLYYFILIISSIFGSMIGICFNITKK
ncbi:MAG: TIGR04086 family membrane protein [Bacilli bacterium]